MIFLPRRRCRQTAQGHYDDGACRVDLDPLEYLQFFLALAFVLGLIGLSSLLLRRFGPGGLVAPRRRPGQKHRLEVVESLTLDPRRRALLISRDGVEHLLVLGPQSEMVVETNIIPQNAEGDEAAGDAPTASGTDPMSVLASALPDRWNARLGKDDKPARIERHSPSGDGENL